MSAATAVLKLQRAGFTEPQVEALAEFLGGQAATKADLGAVRSELKGDIAELRSATKADIAELRSELKAEIAGVRAELKADIAQLDLKISELRGELIRWVVGVGFAQVAMLVAVLRLFPGLHP